MTLNFLLNDVAFYFGWRYISYWMTLNFILDDAKFLIGILSYVLFYYSLFLCLFSYMSCVSNALCVCLHSPSLLYGYCDHWFLLNLSQTPNTVNVTILINQFTKICVIYICVSLMRDLFINNFFIIINLFKKKNHNNNKKIIYSWNFLTYWLAKSIFCEIKNHIALSCHAILFIDFVRDCNMLFYCTEIVFC
jgi:hypothetical protein